MSYYTVLLTAHIINLCSTESHKWQLRSYIYSAKNLYTADDDSVCDPYASVSFHSQTQQTWTCKKTLCPEWDQTLLFKDIVLYGQPTAYAENSPYVCVTLYDKHKLVSITFICKKEGEREKKCEVHQERERERKRER